MSGLVSTMMGWGGDNLMSGLLMALMLGAMVVGYFAAAPGNPLATRLGTLKDRVSGKAPVGKKQNFKFTFSMATLKKLVEALKLTRGEEAQSTPTSSSKRATARARRWSSIWASACCCPLS